MVLLLLLFLLYKLLFFVPVKRLENIRLEQRAANVVELKLYLVKIIVQPGLKNFLDGAKLEFGGEAAAKLFSFIGKASLGDTGDATQRIVQALDAEPDGAGKIFVQHEEVCYVARVHLGAVGRFED